MHLSFSSPSGPPDVDQPCEPSLQAWSPELHLYHMNMTVPCPAEGCSLELLFQHPVQADTLTLWVTYLSMDSSPALFDTEILLEHQKSVHLGPLDTFCDVPLTIKLHVDGKVVGVKVYTFDERMEIDAALLTSQPHSPLCSGCRPVRYQVLREPPFASGLPVVVMHPHRKFTDMWVGQQGFLNHGASWGFGSGFYFLFPCCVFVLFYIPTCPYLEKHSDPRRGFYSKVASLRWTKIFPRKGKMDALIDDVITMIVNKRGPWMICWSPLVAQMVKNPPAVQETWVQSLGQEDPLEKDMATHFSILA